MVSLPRPHTCPVRSKLHGAATSWLVSFKLLLLCRLSGASESCNSCGPGTEPSAERTHCASCAKAGTVSVTGAKCEPCKQGTAPSANKQKCDICPAGKVSARGVACDSCQDKTQRPTQDQSKCICPAGTYNSSFGLIFCFEHSYVQDAILLDR